MMALGNTYETIILEIKSRREDFSKVEFIHEGRQTNLNAHLLEVQSVSLLVGMSGSTLKEFVI
jgi:hypothetical protein